MAQFVKYWVLLFNSYILCEQLERTCIIWSVHPGVSSLRAPVLYGLCTLAWAAWAHLYYMVCAPWREQLESTCIIWSLHPGVSSFSVPVLYGLCTLAWAAWAHLVLYGLCTLVWAAWSHLVFYDQWMSAIDQYKYVVTSLINTEVPWYSTSSIIIFYMTMCRTFKYEYEMYGHRSIH